MYYLSENKRKLVLEWNTLNLLVIDEIENKFYSLPSNKNGNIKTFVNLNQISSKSNPFTVFFRIYSEDKKNLEKNAIIFERFLLLNKNSVWYFNN